MTEFNIEPIIDKVNILEEIFDAVRLVDPIRKKVVYYSLNKEIKKLNENDHCYDFWARDKICDNCISVRALNENETYTKLEFNGEKIFMITTSNVDIGDTKLVIELLKDITESGIVEEFKNNSIQGIYKLLDKQNELLVKDELTKVYNRRYINERLPFDIADNMMNDSNLSIIMADIDKFKNINDTYGHIVGDKILHDFANLLQSCVRKNHDWVARYGGEEFIVLLKNTNEEQGYFVAEKLRKKIEDFVFQYDDISIKITSSFGISTINQNSIEVDSLINKADKNLYIAKRNGRNKVVSDKFNI